MNIKSETKSKKSFFNGKIDFKNAYWKTFYLIIIVSTIINLLPISWGIGILIVILSGGILTFILNLFLGYYDVFGWTKYFILMSLLIFFTSPIHILPAIHDYQTEERIDEKLPLETSTKVYYNDENCIFILFLGDEKQPLVIDKGGNSESYNKLKANFLDNKIKVEKKRVKSWIDDEAEINYYLGGSKFN